MKKEFQFPTGWNSTHSTPKMVYDVYGFNSQRDGILLSYYADLYLKFGFQFPTGWNSTARILPFFYVERVKSIYFYALKWTKFKKAPITQCPKFQHFKILKATLSLSICIMSANAKISI